MDSDKQPTHPIFIVGVPQSGTTVIASILSAHPRIAIAPETHFLNRWVPRYGSREASSGSDIGPFWAKVQRTKRFSNLGVEPARVRHRARNLGTMSYRTLFQAILEEYALNQGRPRWGEKTPAHDQHLTALRNWFPDAQVIYMLRDPRAAVASLLRTPAGARLAEDSHAIYWARSVARIRRWEHDPKVRIVRYEDLVANPASQTKAVLEFLGETPSDGALARPAPSDLEGGDDWQTELTERQVRIIEHYAGAEMERVDYTRNTDGISGIEPTRLALARSLRRTRNRLLAIVRPTLDD